MTSRLTTQSLDSMAWTIDRHGIDAIPVAVLTELGFQARQAGMRPTLANLLIDRAAPSVARQRVFGLIAGLVARPIQGPTDDRPEITNDQVAVAA